MAVLLGGYLTWNLLYAGTATPVSGQIKQWWGVLYARLYGSVMNRGLGELLGNQAWGLARLPIGFLQKAIMAHLDYAAVPQLINAGVAASVLIVLAAQRKWLVRLVDGLALFALFMGLYVQIFYYTATPYWRPRSWYWAGEMVFVVLLGGILLESVRRALLKFSLIQRHWGIVVAILAGACMLSFAQMIWRDFPYRLVPDDRNNFMNRIHELEANTAPGSLIGMPGGGTTAYFIQGRTIVNLDGLINTNDYFESLRTGTGSQFLDDLGLDYVLAAEDWPDQRPYRRVFSGRLAPVREIGPQYLFRYLAGHP